MVAQMMGENARRAERAVIERMPWYAGEAHRLFAHRPGSHAACGLAQRARCAERREFSGKGRGDPRPVLRPDRAVVQDFPGDRSEQQSEGGPADELQYFSAC